ncbi:MAG: O-antigen ligase family protein, partial [Dehalococcoidia bacterium]
AGLVSSRAMARWMAGMLTGAAALAVVLMLLPSPAGTNGDAGERIASIPDALTSGLTGRTEIWSTSLELAAERPWFAFEDGGPSYLRQLFGYGPDTFVYVYPLAQTPPQRETITLTRSGHNHYVHVLVEQGLLGLLGALGLTVVPLAAGGWLLLRRSAAYPLPYRLLLAAILAALAGRTVEQMVGISQLSDTLLHWGLLGALVALPRVARAQPHEASAPLTVATRPLIIASTAVMVAWVLLAGVVVTRTVQPLMASRDAAASASASAAGDRLVALERIVSAIERAPEASAYRLTASGLLGAAIDPAMSEADRLSLRASALGVVEEGVESNRLSLTLNAAVAEQRWASYLAGLSEPESVVAAYVRVAQLLPNHPQPQRNLDSVRADLGP